MTATVYVLYDKVHKCFLCVDMTWTPDLSNPSIMTERTAELAQSYVEDDSECVVAVRLVAEVPS